MQSERDLVISMQQKILVEIITGRAARRDTRVQDLFDAFGPRNYESVRKAIDTLVRTKILRRRNDTLFINRKKQKLIDAILRI